MVMKAVRPRFYVCVDLKVHNIQYLPVILILPTNKPPNG